MSRGEEQELTNRTWSPIKQTVTLLIPGAQKKKKKKWSLPLSGDQILTLFVTRSDLRSTVRVLDEGPGLQS